MLRRFTTKKPESPTPVVVVPPDIAHPAALALQTAARGMTARRLRTELAEGSRAARRHGFLLIVAERAYLWRLQLLAEHFEAPLRAASGSGALPADAARQCFGVLHELLAVHARLLSKLEVHLAPDADEGSLAGVLLDAARSDWGAYPKQAKLWAHAGEVRACRARGPRASERRHSTRLHLSHRSSIPPPQQHALGIIEASASELLLSLEAKAMAAAGGGDAGGTSTRAAPAAAAEGSAPPHAPGGLLRALLELPLSRITMYEQLPAHTSSRSQHRATVHTSPRSHAFVLTRLLSFRAGTSSSRLN